MIGDNILKWGIRSFIRVGIPQGSVLGPILYLIYVNDINYNLVKSSIVMFADDSVLRYSSPDPNVACKTIERDLSSVCKYFANIGFMLNARKTKIMHFSKYVKDSRTVTFP